MKYIMQIITPNQLKLLKKILIASILDFGPILLFLLSFTHFHIYKATMVLMAATIVSTVVTYRTQKRLPYVALYVAFLTIVFGYMTLAHKEPKFIQIKDTLYDATSALVLIIGMLWNTSLLKISFHEIIPMTKRAWDRLTYAWIFYFTGIAITNEYVRRTVDLWTWFDYKAIITAVTVIFGVVVLYLCYEKENK